MGICGLSVRDIRDIALWLFSCCRSSGSCASTFCPFSLGIQLMAGRGQLWGRNPLPPEGSRMVTRHGVFPASQCLSGKLIILSPLEKRCRRSVLGSTGSPRTDNDISKINSLPVRPESRPGEIEGRQRIRTQSLRGKSHRRSGKRISSQLPGPGGSLKD